MSGVIVVITGPSCAGKSTLEAELAKRGMGKVISHTTRIKRPGEVQGKDYFFCTNEYMDWMISEGNFVEVVEFNGNRYGASKDEFKKWLDQGKHVVVVVEPEGREQVIQFAENNDIPVLPVFVTNPANVIADRFIKRSFGEFVLGMSESGKMQKAMDTAAKRLDVMLSEEVNWRQADHPNAILFGRFDEKNKDLVVGRIMQRVESLGG